MILFHSGCFKIFSNNNSTRVTIFFPVWIILNFFVGSCKYWKKKDWVWQVLFLAKDERKVPDVGLVLLSDFHLLRKEEKRESVDITE